MMDNRLPPCFKTADPVFVMDAAELESNPKAWKGKAAPVVTVIATGGYYPCHTHHHVDQMCKCTPSNSSVASTQQQLCC